MTLVHNVNSRYKSLSCVQPLVWSYGTSGQASYVGIFLPGIPRLLLLPRNDRSDCGYQCCSIAGVPIAQSRPQGVL
jgi:hypothetical protein